MRISINLAQTAEPRERYAAAFAIPVALGAAGALVYLLFTGVQDIGRYRNYRAGRIDLQGQEARWNESARNLRDDLDSPQRREAFRMVKVVNTLIDRRQISVTGLLEKVTGLLPPTVRLNGLVLSQGAGGSAVRISVAGKSPEAVEIFLSNLEDSPNFRDVSILEQGVEPEGGGEGQAALSCSATYVGGTIPRKAGQRNAEEAAQDTEASH